MGVCTEVVSIEAIQGFIGGNPQKSVTILMYVKDFATTQAIIRGVAVKFRKVIFIVTVLSSAETSDVTGILVLHYYVGYYILWADITRYLQPDKWPFLRTWPLYRLIFFQLK